MGSTHQKSQMCHHFLERFLVSFYFALDSVLFFFLRTRACGVYAQEIKWSGMLVEYIPGEANIYSKIRNEEGLSRAVGWDSGGAGSPSLTCNISASDLPQISLFDLTPHFLLFILSEIFRGRSEILESHNNLS